MEIWPYLNFAIRNFCHKRFITQPFWWFLTKNHKRTIFDVLVNTGFINYAPWKKQICNTKKKYLLQKKVTLFVCSKLIVIKDFLIYFVVLWRSCFDLISPKVSIVILVYKKTKQMMCFLVVIVYFSSSHFLKLHMDSSSKMLRRTLE